jgi:hypothetical protein
MLTRIHREGIVAATHVPTAGCDLTQLTNEELIAGTRRLVGASNQVFAMLLAHLGEVEARGLHRERACASLYTYCIYELRFSEDAAFRRVSAARLVKRFPVLYGAIASGELHLTGLLMLGPHLTPENHLEVLARAKHRTKKELGKLLRTLAPLPEPPARIEPLGPAPARPAKLRPSWADFVESLCPPVRDLPPGDAPREWVGEGWDALLVHRPEGIHQLEPAPARAGLLEPASGPSELLEPASGPSELLEPASGPSELLEPAPARAGLLEPAPARAGLLEPASGPSELLEPAPARAGLLEPAPARSGLLEPAPARAGLAPVTGPLRYGVQFSVAEEYVQLVEQAKALLSQAHSKSSLEEIHLRAMRLLVAELEKQRFGAKPRPRKPPAATRRSVYERDGGRCSYVDETGQRCRETRWLELHHLQAFARGGTHEATNVTLRCRAHNELAAEQDFGRACAERAASAQRHESLAAQTRGAE